TPSSYSTPALATLRRSLPTLFITVGQVPFEIPPEWSPTRGGRFSFMLGAATLLVSTLLYLVMWQIRAPLWVGGCIRAPRARVHILLRRHRGMAGRRAQRHRIHS